MKFDVMTLATILSEEFERDSWGDIEPEFFEGVAKYAAVLDADTLAGKRSILSPDEDGFDEDDHEYVVDLHAVLTRVVARLNAASVKE